MIILSFAKLFYGDGYERTTTVDTTRHYYYLSGNVLMVRQERAVDKYYHQGSIIRAYSEAGTEVFAASYDAWGKQTVEGNTIGLRRDYTGHEMLADFKLINMNGRLYDPLIGRFLSPDNYVQLPDNSQNFNRYSYCLNNPLKYVDPSGEFIHLIFGAAVGGFVNWVTNGLKLNAKGLGYFAIGAVSGAIGAGIGSGINAAIAGGSFGAGAIGAATGVSSAGALSGLASGASVGFVSGLVTGAGNSWIGGNNVKRGLFQGLTDALYGSLVGGLLGGLRGGLDALNEGVDFWTGNTSLDLTQAYGASGARIGDKTITGKYVGKYEGVKVYESSKMRTGNAASLPGRGIVLSRGEFTRHYNSSGTQELLQHEFGHILEARIVGLEAFYKIIAKESLLSASMDGVLGWSHNKFWTETWANYLSKKYFGAKSLLGNDPWIAEKISLFNLSRLLSVYVVRTLL